jgi:putative zinc finger/helix-turn-helix YgiT family protein
MKCFQCEKGTMVSRMADVAGAVRGEKLVVRCEAMVCGRCGFQVLSEGQSDKYNLAITDAYKRKHGLLTSQALRALRKSLGMSQGAFADFVGVGVASLKRWETGLVQDAALDSLVRVRTNLAEARRNVARIEELG